MKKCPYCAEEIQDEAIICRFCGRDLQSPGPPQAISPHPSQIQQTAKPPAKKSNRLIKLIGIGAAVVITFCCVIGAGLVLSSGQTPRPASATPPKQGGTVVISINTSLATNTPLSTDTPLVTNTPVPTRTPRATRTPQPTVDPYILKAAQKFSEFSDAYFDVNKYVQQVANDPMLSLDKDWKTNTGLALGILNFRADALGELEPSPGYEKLNSYLVELAKETHLFTDSYARGIDHLDSELITAASVHIQNMTKIMQDATLELNRIKANR